MPAASAKHPPHRVGQQRHHRAVAATCTVPALACLRAGLTPTVPAPVTTIGVTIGVTVDACAAANLGLDARTTLTAEMTLSMLSHVSSGTGSLPANHRLTHSLVYRVRLSTFRPDFIAHDVFVEYGACTTPTRKIDVAATTSSGDGGPNKHTHALFPHGWQPVLVQRVTGGQT